MGWTVMEQGKGCGSVHFVSQKPAQGGGATGRTKNRAPLQPPVPCWSPGVLQGWGQKLEDTRDGSISASPISTPGMGGDSAGVASTPESPATLTAPLCFA